ncbi:tetratricopeptide repeat protein [Clostridium botulinum]|uniref:tetratricopeptide repeat protein n=1 Tax=Clostridium botulinum TaxID=1491 RepID=UPI00174C3AE2|nr:tetratricopeptide repeat protein [Clostridium botulinum]MBD5643967.1 tetratricopeptide repeat protein [Clostridium botulinum]
MGIKKTKKQKIILFTILFFALIAAITIPIMNNELKFSKLVTEANVCFDSKNYKKAAELYDDALSLSPMFKDIKSVRKNLSKAKILNESSNNFNEGMDSFKNKNYESAMYLFSKIPKEDTQNYKEAIKKIEESKPLLTKHMIEKANKEASNNEFGNALSFIDQGLKNDPNNKELISLKNKCEKQNDAMQAAQDKANAEAEAEKAKAEAEKYKPKRITQSDNYNVWSVYLKEGVNTFKISVPNEDAENVIAKLEGSLLINEIGQGTYANSIKIPNDGWYRLEITAINRYSWKFE